MATLVAVGGNKTVITYLVHGQDKRGKGSRSGNVDSHRGHGVWMRAICWAIGYSVALLSASAEEFCRQGGTWCHPWR